MALLAYGVYYLSIGSLKIKSVTLNSPDHSALKEDITITLNKSASVYLEYWKKGSTSTLLTPTTKKKDKQKIHLLLLEPNTEYYYKIHLKNIFKTVSQTYSFRTREQSPWMVHDWIKDNKPHDSTAIGEGMVMICYRGYPGYIAMVDGKGTIRWYWQDKKLGVRLATITSRNTILALLAPAGKDEFHKKKAKKPKGIKNYYIRTGKTGFAGGTEIAEISLEGKVLWRKNIEAENIIFHHDLRMDKNNHIISIFRDYKLYNLDKNKAKKDTLWGDGVMVMDTTGQVLKKWSVWDVWDISKDKKIKELANDRFHFNTVSFDKDGNYLISTPIENQIWKVNSTSGQIMWKFGKEGDFKMNPKDYFYFQHDAHIDREGHLMLFDNGDFSPNDTTKVNKSSRALSFDLNMENMTATKKIDAPLPHQYYTSRMGSAFLLPNDHILQTSSKTGNILITNQNGKVLWALNTYFIPYRAEYVPHSLWHNYIQNQKP